MSNDSSTPAQRPEPTLPEFDPRQTQLLPDAPTGRAPVAPPQTTYAYAAADATAAPASSAPERHPRWSAKQTAVTAGLALVLASAGAIGAAAAVPAGSTADTARFGGGAGQGRVFSGARGPRGLQNQQVAPNQQLGPNQQLDPSQLLQMAPQDLLRLLEQQQQQEQQQQPAQPSPSGVDGTTQTT